MMVLQQFLIWLDRKLVLTVLFDFEFNQSQKLEVDARDASFP